MEVRIIYTPRGRKKALWGKKAKALTLKSLNLTTFGGITTEEREGDYVHGNKGVCRQLEWKESRQVQGDCGGGGGFK